MGQETFCSSSTRTEGCRRMLSWTCSVSSASESIPKALETVWALDFPPLLQGWGRSLSCPRQDDPNDLNAGRRDPPCRDSSVPWSRLFPPSPPAFCLRCQGSHPLLRVPWCWVSGNPSSCPAGRLSPAEARKHFGWVGAQCTQGCCSYGGLRLCCQGGGCLPVRLLCRGKKG